VLIASLVSFDVLPPRAFPSAVGGGAGAAKSVGRVRLHSLLFLALTFLDAVRIHFLRVSGKRQCPCPQGAGPSGADMLDLFCRVKAPADAGVGLPAGLDVCMRGVQVCLGLLCRGFGARARRLATEVERLRSAAVRVWAQLGRGTFQCGRPILDALEPDGRGQLIDGVGGGVATAVFMIALDGLRSGCGLAAGALLLGQGPRSACIPKLGNAARPPSSWPASVN
jgi:hypothetical protein